MAHWSNPTFFGQFEALLALAAVSGLVALVGLVLQGHAQVASVAAVLAGPLLIAGAVGLVILTSRGVRWAPVALILFAAVDLGYYGLSYGVYRRTDYFQDFIAATLKPSGSTDVRVIADATRFDQPALHTGNQMTLAGWRRADGYAGLEPQRQLDYRSLAALRVAGVRWVKRAGSAGGVEGLLGYDPHWLEVPQPLPRVRMVSQAATSRHPAQDVQAICLDTTALSEVPLALPPATPGTATLTVERPGRLQIAVQCPTPQLLVVAESFHAGWTSTVDGTPQTVLRINGDFMGCPVPAGQHRVVFAFHPRSLWLGGVDSCLGLGLLPFALIAGFRRRQKQIPEDFAP